MPATAGSSTSAGTKLYISAGAPATQDAAGYAALAWTLVKRVESLPAFGSTTDPVSFQPLDGPEEINKGAVKNGQMQVMLAFDEVDAGQTLLRTAAAPGNNALYSFKVLYPTGAIRYFQARVLGAPEEVGGANNVLKTTATLALCVTPVAVPAP